MEDRFTANAAGATESYDSKFRSLAGEDRFVEKVRTRENLDPQGVGSASRPYRIHSMVLWPDISRQILSYILPANNSVGTRPNRSMTAKGNEARRAFAIEAWTGSGSNAWRSLPRVRMHDLHFLSFVAKNSEGSIALEAIEIRVRQSILSRIKHASGSFGE
jgi:hypothetical protein